MVVYTSFLAQFDRWRWYTMCSNQFNGMLNDPLSPGRCGWDVKYVNVKNNLEIDILSIQVNIPWNECQSVNIGSGQHSP